MAKRVLTQQTVSVAADEIMSLSDLTFGQRQRVNYLSSIFPDVETAIKIVQNLEPRGQNSWLVINQKLSIINNADRFTKSYHDATNQEFEIGQEVTSEEIVSAMGNIRRNLDLPPYTGRLKRQCEEDFFTLFIVHDVIRTTSVGRKSKSDVIAYKVIVRLKPLD